ncbi:trypsin-like peptidase domain-containing protein [Microcoleus sp. B3-A4]|uniref:nSTAND1 domain-containing NTPase n=1 Tax=Microcoleus sp. B3-A4 TaxID=2818653 RepID=UPI002FD07AFE
MSLESSLVRIYYSKDNVSIDKRIVIGAGFLVSQNSILTCAHVVADALNIARDTAEMPDAKISLDFPLVAPKQILKARVIFWRPVNPDEFAGDIAGLELENSAPDAARPAQLVTSDELWGHRFRVFGFPQGKPDGVWASGELRARLASDWVQLEDVKQEGYRLERGFSGAPIWDEELHGVAGMAVANEKRPETKAAFIIPANVLIKAWSDLREQAIPACPYRGLSAFREEDAQFFFGRENFTQQLVDVVQTQQLVAVIGSSGSGKSSVVFAGLVPQLRQQGTWLIGSFRPGKDAFLNLAISLISLQETQMSQTDQLVEANHLATELQQGNTSLADVVQRILQQNSGNLLLIADQFEELYTLYPDEKERKRFLDLLLAVVTNHTPRFRLVLVLRADFMEYALSYPRFADALQQFEPQLLGPMKPEELQDAIEKPAQLLGVQIEPGLTNRILADVNREPGNLPLLEFALTQLWEKQNRGNLTHDGYEEIGRVAKGLANHAEDVYARLNREEQQQTQQIFLQLVRPGEGTDDARRLATREEVKNWNLVTRLANDRLLVTGRNEQTGNETVEVVHEALLQKWERLHNWINDNRAFLAWQERLRVVMRQWESKNNQEGYLLQGAPLAEAEDWHKKRTDELSEKEKKYIQTSLNESNRKQNEKLRSQRVSIFVLSALIVLLLGLFFGVLGLWQRSDQQRKTKELESSSLSALQKVENTPIDSLVIAMENGKELKDLVKERALEEYPTVSPLLALQTILDNIELQNQFETKQKGVNSVIFDEVRKRIVTAGEDGTVRLFDFNGKELLRIEAHKGGVRSVRFLRDNKNEFVTGGNDGTAKLWDISSPKERLETFDGHQCNPLDKKKCGVQNVRFPKGSVKIMATSGEDGTLRLWNLQGKELSKIQAHKDSVESINFSPDDKLIATAGKDGVARLWQLNGNQINKTSVAEFKGHQGSVNSVFFSPNGRTIATAGDDGTVRLWNLQGQQLKKITAHIGSVKAVRFSPTDDKLLATAGTDGTEGTVRLWSLNSKNDAKLLAEFKGHQGRIESIRFSEDGKTIVSAGANDGTVRIWTVPQKQFRQQLKEHKGSINSVRFSPDGKYLATAGDDKQVILNRTRDGKILQKFPHPKKVKSVRFNPKQDEKILVLATAGEDGIVRLWDLNGNKQKELDAGGKTIESVNFSNDGNFLAAGGDDTIVRLWSLNRNPQDNPQYSFTHGSKVKAIRFSPMALKK